MGERERIGGVSRADSGSWQGCMGEELQGQNTAQQCLMCLKPNGKEKEQEEGETQGMSCWCSVVWSIIL